MLDEKNACMERDERTLPACLPACKGWCRVITSNFTSSTNLTSHARAKQRNCLPACGGWCKVITSNTTSPPTSEACAWQTAENTDKDKIVYFTKRGKT